VEYFEAPFDNPVQRHPNVYMPLPLYDPAALAAKWAGLEKKYGKEKTDRARGYAGLVYRTVTRLPWKNLSQWKTNTVWIK